MPDYYIGLMSGTSLDAVDAVLVDFSQSTPTLIEYYSHPFPKNFRHELLETIQPDWVGSLYTIGTLDQKLGYLFADAVDQLTQKANISNSDVIAIGSHGHTLWHEPSGEYPFSLQLGNANVISEQTKITTVADFRSRDIAAGGQGAPLVPAFHFKYLTHPTKNRVLLNIGGIANISYLPAEDNPNTTVFGFDTGPGNGLLDAWIFKHKKNKYDKNGDWAKSGTPSADLLTILKNDPYFTIPAPKSTGKEYFNLDWLDNNLKKYKFPLRPEDIQATLTKLTTNTITDASPQCDEVLIFGGGIHNKFLIELLKLNFLDTKVMSSDVIGIDPDWMEAIAFAWLAKQSLNGEAGNLPEATGAQGSRILGAIYQSTTS